MLARGMSLRHGFIYFILLFDFTVLFYLVIYFIFSYYFSYLSYLIVVFC
jgi:hypothetical protein